MEGFRTVNYTDIAAVVERLCIECAYELPPDVLDALRNARQKETEPHAKRILEQLIENADIARNEHIPLCQDTGLTVVFIRQGAKVVVIPPVDRPDATLFDAINEGVAAGYEKGLLRKSIVQEPLNNRKNTGTNTPAVIHHEVVPGDGLSLSVITKGGGCENKSMFRMFNPTQTREDLCRWIVDVVRQAGANACPPFIIGVGLGGNFERACLLSKKALLRNIPDCHGDTYYRGMEETLLADINALGVGPQGLGGNTTALAVKIETEPCHIASLPVAVNIECHSHRHKSAQL